MFKENIRMIEDVKKGRRILHPILYLFIAVVFYALSVIFETVVQLIFFVRVLGPEKAMDPFWSISVMLFSFVFTTLLVFLFVRFAEGRPLRSLGLYSKGWLINLLKGIFWGIVFISLTMGIYAVMGLVTVDSPASQPVGIAAAGPISILFIGFLVQGGTEEIVSRGWLLNVISARYNKILGIALSTLYFLSCHIFNAGFNFLVVVNIVLFSVFLCLYVFRANNLWVAMGFHGAWNFAIGNIYGMDVSGNKIGAGSVFDLSINGDEIFTGGVFGIEGGIIISFVLILGIAVLLILESRNQKKTHTNE